MKRFLTIFLAIVLALPVCNINISANSNENGKIKSVEYQNPNLKNSKEDSSSDEDDVITASAEYHSPLSKLSSKQISKASHTGKTYKASAVSTNEAVKQMRNMMKKRYSSFTITFKAPKSDVNPMIYQMMDMSCNHTGVPDEGDYIKWNIYSWYCTGNRTYTNGSYVYSLTYDIEYLTTPAQEMQLTNEINKFFKTYNLKKLTDYEKTFYIYNYICNNVEYDNDSYDLEMFSAYAAMCKKKAVCQGYSTLFYRMLLTAGVNNRFIGGTIDGDQDSGHAWNIVAIKQSNGKTLYYKCDSTWDAQSGDYYNYFLCGSSDEAFYDHVRDPEYTTSAFNKAYPLSPSNFDGAILNSTRYLDVDKSDWYYDVVNKISDLGYMGACDDYLRLFAPDNNITRGMVATVLYRIAGAPNVSFQQKFSDVKANMWYSNAITWASNSGIINGYNNGKFGPDDPITREQIAVMMRNFAMSRGKNTNSNLSLGGFVDNKNITAYAKSAMQWAVSKSIISGSKTSNGTYLNPTKKATRGECAKMFYVFYNIVK